MGKGHRWLKRMRKDRIINLSKIKCDKLFFEDKLVELGGREEEARLRTVLGELTKKQNENADEKIKEKKTSKEQDDELIVKIKGTNTKIDTISAMIDESKGCDMKMVEFSRYIGVLNRTLDNPDEIKRFNSLWN